MEVYWKPASALRVTPHKVTVCVLIQLYATPASEPFPFPFSTVAEHNRFAIFLISLIKATDNFLEQSLERLIRQLKAVTGELDAFIAHRLTDRLSSFSSADDLFNFFSGLQVVFSSSDMENLEDDQISLDTNSILGMFLRRCILSFNIMSFEGVCHLQTSIEAYCKQFLSCSKLSNYYSPIRRTFSVFDANDQKNEAKLSSHGNIRLGSIVPDHLLEIEVGRRASKLMRSQGCSSLFGTTEENVVRCGLRCLGTIGLMFAWFLGPNLNRKAEYILLLFQHSREAQGDNMEMSKKRVKKQEGHKAHFPDCLYMTREERRQKCPVATGLHEPLWTQVSVRSKFSSIEDSIEDRLVSQFNDEVRVHDHAKHLFLSTSWQIQGYLTEQADLIENNKGLLTLHEFEDTLKLLQKLAPDLHRLHYLHHLNSLHHEDYTSSLDNLHCYFDYSAGLEGIDTGSSSFTSNPRDGKYETALLCLGVLHCHFGHFMLAMEALTEAVQICHKNNNDSGLAYTLAAICNLLSNSGISSMGRILDVSFSGSHSSLNTSSTQQHLFVLLRQSLQRAESLRNAHLVGFIHLAIAKFDLNHIKRPPLSFGPNSSTRLRSCPVSVCKALRVSPYLLSEFGSDGTQSPIDGSFSTSWLKELEKPNSSSMLLGEVGSGCDDDLFKFTGQPSVLPSSVLQLSGASYLIRATSWELYGSAVLSRLNALVHATCFADSSSSADISLAYVKLIKHLAAYKGYQEAFRALVLAEKRFPPLSHFHIQVLRLELLHDHFIHRGCLKQAQQVCDELGVLASSVSGIDMDLKAETIFCHARTLLAAKQFDQAASVAHSLFCLCYKYNMQINIASVLLLIADIHKNSENATSGLPYALACLTYCQSFNLDLLGASAMLTLADLWLALGSTHAKRASSLLHQALPMIVGHGGLELRSKAHISIAKCYLADSSFSVFEDPGSVLSPLRYASEELEILEYHELAAEVFYLTSVIYNVLGKFDERDAAADSFKKHLLALENPGDQDDSVLWK